MSQTDASGDEIILECTDICGSIVRFHKKNYDKHKKKHRVLEQQHFCPGQIMKALKQPTLTIKGNLDGTVCYYLEEFSIGGIIRYTKVVVLEKFRNARVNPHCVIMTAFQIDHIQETKYGYAPKYY